ncbi:MAG: TetR/AcrR family transcriptional regulator [Thermodesulfobacteriota bacterium]
MDKPTAKDDSRPKVRPQPPGRIKIMNALRSLLEEKEFGAITWTEIAQTAGVNEGLIYKYFKDKRNLLHQVLTEYLEDYFEPLKFELKGIEGALNKIRKLIWANINMYSSNRVFAKILLLEVRNFPGYFHSETYQLVQEYANMLLEIIEEGIQAGEIRDDIPPKQLRQIVLGMIEHLCLPGLVFNQEISPDTLTQDMCMVLYKGIEKARK